MGRGALAPASCNAKWVRFVERGDPLFTVKGGDRPPPGLHVYLGHFGLPAATDGTGGLVLPASSRASTRSTSPTPPTPGPSPRVYPRDTSPQHRSRRSPRPRSKWSSSPGGFSSDFHIVAAVCLEKLFDCMSQSPERSSPHFYRE